MAKTVKQQAPPAVEAPKANKTRQMLIVARPGVSEDRLFAEHALDPTSASATTAVDFSKHLFADLSLQECAMVMKEGIQEVNGGNLDKLEGMLTGQAMALNAIFNKFAMLSSHSDHLPKVETYIRMALKAQSQCRTTVEAIAEIKYPKSATFIKQANIAQQQQVNNGQSEVGNPASPARAREKDITPTNELLEAPHGERVDIGTTGTTIGLNPELETMGAVNRAH